MSCMAPISSCELAAITEAVTSVLDITVTRTRTTATTQDGYGHTTPATTASIQVQVNVIKPSATQLQAFAGIIESQRAMFVRGLQTADIREGDHIAYAGLDWLVQNELNAASYSVTKQWLMTVVT